MARPTKPKDIKPKAEGDAAPAAVPVPSGGGGGGLDLKFLITIVVIVLATSLTSAASVYFLAPMVLGPQIEAIGSAGGDHGEDSGEHAPAHRMGMNLELDEFTVNLKSDPNLGGNQFLRARIALNIYDTEENCFEMTEHHASLPPMLEDGGAIVGAAAPINTLALADDDAVLLASGGGAPAVDPFDACNERFNKNMAPYTPNIRDVINTALMKRTAGTLSTIEGQEALKDEISEEVNQYVGPRFEVLRVNFADFIIQK